MITTPYIGNAPGRTMAHVTMTEKRKLKFQSFAKPESLNLAPTSEIPTSLLQGLTQLRHVEG